MNNTWDIVKTWLALSAPVSVPVIIFLIKQGFTEYNKTLERRRKLYAAAYADCMDFKEFLFVIYRRNGNDRPAERLRISEALRLVQSHMAYHQAWLKTEAPTVSEAYDALVTRTHEVAGLQMKKAWATEPITEDKDMTIRSPIDWEDIASYEAAYIQVAAKALTPFWRRWRKK